MRIHLVAAFFACLLALYFRLTTGKWAVLFITIAAVIAAEAINTAIERLCNRVCSEKDETIKIVKDASAGAVLVLAFFAAVIGVILFWNPQKLFSAFLYIATDPAKFAVFILLLLICILFIVIGPKEMLQNAKDTFKRR